MRRFFLYSTIFSLVAFISSCSQTEQEDKKLVEQSNISAPISEVPLKPVKIKKVNKQTDPQSSDKKQPWQYATVTFLNLEGGFFGLITEQGDKLLPMNLSKEFHLHGAKIKFKGAPKKDVLTIQQWGVPFEISAIEIIESGSGTIK